MVQRAVLIVCVGGTLAFGALFLLTFSNRVAFERAAEAPLIGQLEKQLGVDGLTATSIVDAVVENVPGRAKELTIVRADRFRGADDRPPSCQRPSPLPLPPTSGCWTISFTRFGCLRGVTVRFSH